MAYTSLLEPRLSYVLMVQYYVLMVQFNNLPILILVKGKCCIFRMFSTRNNKQGPPGDVRDCVHRLGAIRGHATGLIWLQKLKLAFPDQEIRHDWDSPECLRCFFGLVFETKSTGGPLGAWECSVIAWCHRRWRIGCHLDENRLLIFKTASPSPPDLRDMLFYHPRTFFGQSSGVQETSYNFLEKSCVSLFCVIRNYFCNS